MPGNVKFGFIGAGQMAQALSAAFIHAKLCEPGNIVLYDVEKTLLDKMAGQGFKTATSNAGVIEMAEVIILAVKPSVVPNVLNDIKPVWGPSKVLVSICAGITIPTLLETLGEKARVVRVMPNTPCLVAKGASGFALSSGCRTEDGELVKKLMDACGISFMVDEKLLDAVTGLSGSGPAFVYMMIEALSDGGVRVGLPRNVATALAAQTVAGAADMVIRQGMHPAVLKEQVTSPGGTTIAGVVALERNGLRNALISAVEAATERSAELGRAAHK